MGSSEIAMEFTDIISKDQLFEIATEGMQAKTGSETPQTQDAQPAPPSPVD